MKRNQDRKDKIVNLMERGDGFCSACELVGVNRITGWRWRHGDGEFDRRVQEADWSLKIKRFEHAIAKMEQSFEGVG